MFTTADKPKLFPLRLNEATGEPCLQLPSPHERIRITPIRPSDADMVKAYLNDPRVYEFLAGPPFPYTEQNANDWVSRCKENSDAIFSEILEGNRFVGGCPVRCIRELQDDGTDIFIGDIGIDREDPDAPWVSVEYAENLKKKAGDPTIMWSIGDYLAPSHHRRGIMSAAVRALIHVWAIPRMNCRRITATAFLGNVASVGVFLKVGFQMLKEQKDAVRLPEGRGGQLVGLHIMQCVLEDKKQDSESVKDVVSEVS